MPDVQAGLSVAWRDGAVVEAALSLAWRDAGEVQSIGSGYIVPDPGTGVPLPPVGDQSPGTDIPDTGDGYYPVAHEMRVFDLRTGDNLPAERVSVAYSDGGVHHTVTVQGAAEMATALRAGEQPAQIGVEINDDVWHFVVEEIDQPRAFASDSVSVRGRSLAALAGAPYQAEQQWQLDAPTTAAQMATLAQSVTALEVDWQVGSWLLPAGSWSFQGDPLAVVRALAAAIGADVIAKRDSYGVIVRARYDDPPNVWATTAPAWQIPWAVVESAQQVNADTAEYDGIVVAGPSTGDILQARLAGTSGARQAPMVTDPALTDPDALLLRATSTLFSYGKQVRETRRLQIHERVVRDGELVRWPEPAGTWTGRVRSYSVEASLDNATQTLVLERRTGWISGSVGDPPPVVVPPSGCLGGPLWAATTLLSGRTRASAVGANGILVVGEVIAGGVPGAQYSTDGGATWTIGTGFTGSGGFPIQHLAAGGGIFFGHINAVDSAYSTDGATWTMSGHSVYVVDTLVYAFGKFLGFRNNGTFYATDNGSTYSYHSGVPANAANTHAAFGDGRLVTIGNDGGTRLSCYSTDGITFTSCTTPPQFNTVRMAYGNNRYVAMFDSTTDKFSWTTDGVVWATATMPKSLQWSDVIFANGVFLACAVGSDELAVSPDGLDWEMVLPARRLTTAAGSLRRLAHDGDSGYICYALSSATLANRGTC